MKKIMLVLVVMFIAATNIKAIEVPEVVEKAFKLKYPEVKKVKWEKENGNEYEASFTIDKKEVSVVYQEDGKLKETETEISPNELPKAIVEAVNKKYPGAVIDEASKIERADNTIVYEAEIQVKRKEMDLLYTPDGNETK